MHLRIFWSWNGGSLVLPYGPLKCPVGRIFLDDWQNGLLHHLAKVTACWFGSSNLSSSARLADVNRHVCSCRGSPIPSLFCCVCDGIGLSLT